MSYDEEYQPDPMEAPIDGAAVAEAKAPGFRILIEASNWDETRISNAVLARVTENITKHLHSQVHKRVQQAVDDTIRDAVNGEIVAEARRLLSEGWEKTDEYGRSNGKKVTMRDRVLDLLGAQSGYSERTTRLEKAIQDTVNEALTKQLKPEIDAAKLKVQQLLDGTLATKLLQAMKEGLR